MTLCLLYINTLLAALEAPEVRERCGFGPAGRRVSVAAQADDVTLVARSREGAAELLHICLDWAEAVGAEFNRKKTTWFCAAGPAPAEAAESSDED